MITRGQKINDRYQIIRTIGEGGMANVYLAHDTILDREVAVKVLRGDLSDDEKFVRRFQREAIASSSLSHPNIVEMYDVGEDDGQYFIVMEYVPGKTLKNLIKRRGALTLSEVIDIMMQLTSGIAHAHASYIIHRDIKPQNVMILDDGRVKITDFGIAMALNSNELTQTNSVMGSVHYLPPEQASGSGSTIKSDIYSLGILMYELLTGKLPFKGENAVEIAIKQMKEPIPSIINKNPDIPQSIENIVLRACAKNPKNRYENVLEMREDLEHALDPDHANDLRITYKYPEQDLEETKIMMPIREKRETVVEEEVNEPVKKDKTNQFLLIGGIISAILVIGLTVFFILWPKLTEVPDIVIPDVRNKTVAEAEQALKKLGFEVATDLVEQSDKDVEKGKVIKTEPQAGRTKKKGSTITLVVSKGKDTLKLENYVGKNYYEIKAMLEAKGIYVLIEKKDVENKDDLKETTILEQKPAVGTEVSENDTVTLYIPNIVTKYPDFVNGGWTAGDVQAFCDEYNLILTIEYKATNDYKEGKIISQSRPADSTLIPKTTIKIVVAKAPEVEPDIDDVIPQA